MLTNIVLVYGIKSCNFIYQHIEKHLILQKYDSFLDLLSMRMKTNRNKIVSFAVEFLKEKYEEIYNRNIGDASIHQYDVSYG